MQRKVSKAFVKRVSFKMHRVHYPDQVFLKKDLQVMGRINGDFKTDSELTGDRKVFPERFAIFTHKGWVTCHVKPELVGKEIGFAI